MGGCDEPAGEIINSELLTNMINKLGTITEEEEVTVIMTSDVDGYTKLFINFIISLRIH